MINTVRIGTLEYQTAEGIAVPHCFTTRRGGVSRDHLDSLNLGVHRGDDRANVEENFRILGAALGFDRNNLVLTNQVHQNTVRLVTKADGRGIDNRDYPECDALITADPGTALLVFTADCTPILLWDQVTGAVGAAHAGWRGTALDIAGATVRAMVREFGCDPAHLHAAIGPNIGPCCFETDAEVPEAMVKALGPIAAESIRPVGQKYYVNLKTINAQFLRNAGVNHIEISADCTMCLHDKYWSHRYTRGHRGSQGAIIVCQEVQP